LNAVIKKDSYPLSRIDIFDQLSGNAWYSTLDLKSGYTNKKPVGRQRKDFLLKMDYGNLK